MPVLAKAQKQVKHQQRLAKIQQEAQEHQVSEVDTDEYFDDEDQEEDDGSDLLSDSDNESANDEEEEGVDEEGEEDGQEGDNEDDQPAAAKEKKIVLKEPQAWVERMTLTATKPLPEDLNVDDDPKREEVFLQHALLSVRQGINLLDTAKVAWRRPLDYYAEMFKSDVHMDKVQDSIMKSKKTIEQRAQRRAAKDQKKFGKEVQAEALRQKAKAKREAMNNITAYRKKRGRDTGDGDEDEFDMSQTGFGKGKGGGGKDKPKRGARPPGASKSLRPGGKKRPGKSKRRGK